jgi:menaquinone-dependent protoporphyrinogen oxidase
MSNKILVAYASIAGSTAGVAEAIGKTLVESGAQVEVRPMKDVNDLAPYQTMVAGSAIRGWAESIRPLLLQ